MANVSDIDEETPGAVSVPSRWRVLYRVPAHVRQDKKHIYEPVVVPLGPYHHGRDPQMQLVEPLKNEVQDIVCGGANRKSFLLRKIRERIDEIRHFYGGADGYTDEELSEMMLRDACFLICYMQEFCSEKRNETYTLTRQRLGMSGLLFMYRDMRMLENQIPLWLISLIHPNQSFLCEYFSYIIFGVKSRMTQLPWGNGRGEEEPLHLLEASQRTCLSLSLVDTQETSSNFVRLINKYIQPRAGKKSSIRTQWQMLNSPFRSVADLKAKGIHFRRSSNCLVDIKFFSFAFYAELHLPFFHVTYNSVVFFSNVIAFEMSPETNTNFGVTSYFSFMKTLIHTANDIKVLREKDILYSRLASDEEVLEIFKSIDTYGFSNRGLFLDVKMRIEEHCNSKARTWMADLINTNFRSPWTAIALAAATILLCLTFLQTYFTINPRN